MATHSVEDLGSMLTSRLIMEDRKHRDRRKPAEIARTTTFIDWVRRGNFIADREPIDLERTWRVLAPIYAAVPRDPVELDIVLQKPAQFGGSIWAMCLALWVALSRKCQGAYFLPVHEMAMVFSQDRFIRMVRQNKAIHALMGDPDSPHQKRIIDEGSASVRRILESIIYFATLSGAISTESRPLDFIINDEVQEMLLSNLQKAEERLSASALRLKAYISTPNFAGADINYYYERSDQREFFTDCDCAEGVNLADAWDPYLGPLCIDHGNGSTPSVPREPFFVCPKCKAMIVDPQEGRFVAMNPGADRIGFHWSQMLSPRQTPTSILKKWITRVDTAHFYRRVLGKPYADPSTLPIQQTHLENAQNRDLAWGASAEEPEATFLGIDQMGQVNYAIVKARIRGTDKQRVIWLEVIQADDPWHRCAELMRRFKIKVCGVEALPNFNEAQRFAKEFPGKVFLVNYQDLAEELVVWGDRPRDKVTVRRTDDMARTKYTAAVDQFRFMSFSLGKWAAGEVETPDARGLVQEMRTDQGMRPIMLCRDVLWLHLQRVALVTEYRQGKEDERRLRRAVKKVGIDPHFAFANMLCDVAWVRIFGTARLLYTDEELERGTTMSQGAPRPTGEMEQLKRGLFDKMTRPTATETCGTCVNFEARENGGRCTYLQVNVKAETFRCQMYQPVPEAESYP